MGWLEDDGESGFIPALVGAFESRMECWSRESLLAAGENLEKEEEEEGKFCKKSCEGVDDLCYEEELQLSLVRLAEQGIRGKMGGP